MPERLDFDSARRVLDGIAPTDTWDEATERAATGPLVRLDDEDPTAGTIRRRPRRTRPPTIRLLAIAACLLAVVAVAAVVTSERQSVDTVPPSSSPTECPSTTQPRATGQGAPMSNRFAVPIASAASAILLLGACNDDDSSTSTTEAPAESTTLAAGDDVELADGQTLNVSAVTAEDDGEVTGEIQLTDQDGEVVVAVECADTDTDGVVVLGGTITEADDDASGLVALFIREGDPDSVAVWYDEGENRSCSDLLQNRHDVLDDESLFVDVEAGSDIATG